jgi:HSP20 family protein
MWNPAADLSETPDHVHIRMEIASVRLEDLTIIFDEGLLRVRGSRCACAPVEDEEFSLMEIPYGGFERTFRLPDSVNEDGIRAVLRDGFLDVEIPKGPSKGTTFRVIIQQERSKQPQTRPRRGEKKR